MSVEAKIKSNKDGKAYGLFEDGVYRDISQMRFNPEKHQADAQGSPLYTKGGSFAVLSKAKVKIIGQRSIHDTYPEAEVEEISDKENNAKADTPEQSTSPAAASVPCLEAEEDFNDEDFPEDEGYEEETPVAPMPVKQLPALLAPVARKESPLPAPRVVAPKDTKEDKGEILNEKDKVNYAATNALLIVGGIVAVGLMVKVFLMIRESRAKAHAEEEARKREQALEKERQRALQAPMPQASFSQTTINGYFG